MNVEVSLDWSICSSSESLLDNTFARHYPWMLYSLQAAKALFLNNAWLLNALSSAPLSFSNKEY